MIEDLTQAEMMSKFLTQSQWMLLMMISMRKPMLVDGLQDALIDK